jgi:hypothetical protein
VRDSVSIQLRYSFTAQFLRGAALFAWRARELEGAGDQAADESTKSEHRAYVSASIMQSVAALEAEISEIVLYGPGHHLGSNGVDQKARDFLNPLFDLIDGQGTVSRYECVLHLLEKPALDKSGQMYESVNLLVKLRNEIVHYKSKWGPEMDRKKLFKGLKKLRFVEPPFYSGPGEVNFFPYQILSASCASWAVSTTIEFIDTFYSLLDFRSPLESHKAALAVPPLQLRK